MRDNISKRLALQSYFYVMFGYRKILRKKNVMENGFLLFGFTMKNTKENQI